jgi:hypothetical protein
MQGIPTTNLVKGKFCRLANKSKRKDAVDIVVVIVVIVEEEEFQNAGVDIDGKITRRRRRQWRHFALDANSKSGQEYSHDAYRTFYDATKQGASVL